MSSPVHRYLFSPPASPPQHLDTLYGDTNGTPKGSSLSESSGKLHRIAVDSIPESSRTQADMLSRSRTPEIHISHPSISGAADFANEINNFLLPVHPQSRSTPQNASAVSSHHRKSPYPELGPGGFNSTATYPSPSRRSSSASSSTTTTTTTTTIVSFTEGTNDGCTSTSTITGAGAGAGGVPIRRQGSSSSSTFTPDGETGTFLMVPHASSSSGRRHRKTLSDLNIPTNSLASHSHPALFSQICKDAFGRWYRRHTAPVTSALPMPSTANVSANDSNTVFGYSLFLSHAPPSLNFATIRNILTAVLSISMLVFLLTPGALPDLAVTPTGPGHFGTSLSTLTGQGYAKSQVHGQVQGQVQGVRVWAQHGAPVAIDYSKGGSRSGRYAAPPPQTYRPSASPSTESRPNAYTYASASLTPELELLALQNFLLEDSTHTLPPSMDLASQPLDPRVVLGYDPELTADGRPDWSELRENIEPVVVWSLGEAWSQPIFNLLSVYSLDPAPRELPIADRPDLKAIQEVMARAAPGRQISSPNPLVTIGGIVIDGLAPLLELHQSGELHEMLERAGAKVDGQKIKEDVNRKIEQRKKAIKQAQVVVLKK